MIGGRIIENAITALPGHQQARRLWCVDRNGDELAVYADDSASVLNCGEEIWWQAGRIYARGDAVSFRKIANSFDPNSRDGGDT